MATRLRVGMFAAVAVLAMASAQAGSFTVDPGTYGSYRSDGSTIRMGNYSVVPTAGDWIFRDITGVQTASVGPGTYTILARDAGVVIGTFDMGADGLITSATGSITVSGSTISMVTHDIAVNGAPGWLPNCRLWNVAWAEFGMTRLVLPTAANWGGWYGNLGDSNNFSIGVADDGTVTVNSDSRGIGITGGLGQLNFPAKAAKITFTPSGKPPEANWMSLDWGTPDLSPDRPTEFSLYPGNYSFLSGMSGGTMTPALGGGNLTIPATRGNWSKTFTWHSNTNGLDYTFTFSERFVIPGDANKDGAVDFADYLILESSYGSAPTGEFADADFDDNNIVEFADYLVLEANYGTSSVPEPMTLTLLGLGALALVRRRHA